MCLDVYREGENICVDWGYIIRDNGQWDYNVLGVCSFVGYRRAEPGVYEPLTYPVEDLS